MNKQNKLSVEEWNKLTREEKREALLRFEEPNEVYQPIIKEEEEKI